MLWKSGGVGYRNDQVRMDETLTWCFSPLSAFANGAACMREAHDFVSISIILNSLDSSNTIPDNFFSEHRFPLEKPKKKLQLIKLVTPFLSS